jgi:oligoribonuclease
MPVHEHNLIWIDLEMTGLNPDRDKILEIATIVTSPQLEVLAIGPQLAIHQSDDVLALMSDFVRNMHTSSGLIERVKTSRISAEAAEAETITFLQEYVPAGKSPMCGNTICQDRRFLFRSMPVLERYFHYRHLDVSTLKELVKRWRPELLDNLKKESRHLALDDIKESIVELKYYREHFIRAGGCEEQE